MTRVTIEVTEQERHQLKVLAALNKLSVKDFILENTIKNKAKKPNKETLKAFDDVKKGKNLTRYNSVQEMFEDLKK